MFKTVHSLPSSLSPSLSPCLPSPSLPPSLLPPYLPSLPSLPPTLQHSIIDEPIDHGVAIVADTNTWTCRVVVASKTYHNK